MEVQVAGYMFRASSEDTRKTGEVQGLQPTIRAIQDSAADGFKMWQRWVHGFWIVEGLSLPSFNFFRTRVCGLGVEIPGQ